MLSDSFLYYILGFQLRGLGYAKFNLNGRLFRLKLIFYFQVSRPLLERSFHRKVQSRKVFTHRESFETIIAKTEEKLSKCRIDYKQCFSAHRQNPSQHSLTEYIDAHNAYVQQLHATNAMLEAYNCDTVPQLLQELEEIYNDLCNIVTEAIVQGAEGISTRVSAFVIVEMKM